MARKKVKLAFIENDSARKSCLKKRRQGLLKKVSELSILCGVETCAVVLSPDDNEPAFWPASRPDVERLLMRYLSIPEIERSRKMVNQEMYLRERNSKLAEQHKKLERKNNDLENHYLMQQLYLYKKTTSELGSSELDSLLKYTDEKIAEIERRIRYIEQRDDAPQSGGAPLAVEGPVEEEETSPEANIGSVGGDGSGGGGDASSWDEWFLDMMKQSGSVAGSSVSKRDTSYPLAYSTGGAGTSSHDVANLPQVNVGVESGNLGHGGGPVYGWDNYPVMPYQGYVGNMSGGLPVGFARGDVPGSSIGGAYGYAMGPPYQWEVGGSSSGHGAMFPHGGIHRSNNNIINAAMQPQENPGGINSGQGMVLPAATGGGSGMGVYRRNDMVGEPVVHPRGNVNASSASYGFSVNQGNAGTRSQGGDHGGYGEVVPPGNTGDELPMPPNNAGADAGGSDGNN
ncbi:agamous-like MADS-box protein AGL86 [Syzygium oleosum]|uniref:agamous-like MADS-box protein AGL86 n=1 Tax=Syzygium oleosum TaxID=219896 RepID=UPI0011D25112|nr:agamous-like MADS-box protein AGL86 [Syzygium oleosum]